MFSMIGHNRLSAESLFWTQDDGHEEGEGQGSLVTIAFRLNRCFGQAVPNNSQKKSTVTIAFRLNRCFGQTITLRDRRPPEGHNRLSAESLFWTLTCLNKTLKLATWSQSPFG